MARLHLHRGNRLEALADALAGILSAPLASALQSEIVAVQSLGMRRWLSQQLAARLGVAANIAFPFPEKLAADLFGAAFGLEASGGAFARDVLPWRVLRALPCLLELPGASELRHYLEGDQSALKHYQLATRIATVLDRYLAYRPEMLLQWEQPGDGDWQRHLWRQLVRETPEAHPAELLRRLASHPTPKMAGLGTLPPRVCIFGLSTLPPFHIQLLGAAARFVDVHLFHLEPSPEYWGDLLTPRERNRLALRMEKLGRTLEDVHAEPPNPLLAATGRAGRDFTQLLLELDAASESDHFTQPAGTGMLAQLQADLFELREPAPCEADPRDLSIQVHCCHGPARELEVLHDHLLELFERLPDLAPRDILVLTPDMETYAPFIEAVFGAPEDPARQIPFTIADRSVRLESGVVDAFLRILDLHGGRFGVATVLDLLEVPALRERFSIGEDDLPQLQAWAEQAAIRWGIDAAHRASFDLPPTAQNSWRDGFKRLLLGYALQGESLFDGTLPCSEIHPGSGPLLGRWIEFAETLFAHANQLAAARPLADWADTFTGLSAALFADNDESADELRRLRRTFESLAGAMAASGCSQPVAFEVIRAHLGAQLAGSESGRGFLGGKATFCALKPMRSIPFRVICMIGMNDGAFPRHDSPLAFDRTAAQPRLGDRNLRDDDRYLFLETLLSARQVLYLSYSGLSIRDNSEAPPCVLLSELLDYLDSRFIFQGAASCRAKLVRRHHLQAFHPNYFGDGRLFSYSNENALAARAAASPRPEPEPFAARPLPAPSSHSSVIALHELARFFSSPADAFLRGPLGIVLPRDGEALQESEPVALDILGRYGLLAKIMEDGLRGTDPSSTEAWLAACGELPHGFLTRLHARECITSAQEMLQAVRGVICGQPLAALPIELAAGSWNLSGTLHGLYPEGLLRARPAGINGKDMIRAWLEHLALNALRPEGASLQTWIFGKEREMKCLQAIAEPLPVLAKLLAHYERGLCMPLPFFPKTSWAFAAACDKGKAPAEALAEARKTWEGGRQGSKDVPGERDTAHALAWRGVADPLDGTFQDLARDIFEPVLAAIAPKP